MSILNHFIVVRANSSGNSLRQVMELLEGKDLKESSAIEYHGWMREDSLLDDNDWLGKNFKSVKHLNQYLQSLTKLKDFDILQDSYNSGNYSFPGVTNITSNIEKQGDKLYIIAIRVHENN